MFSITCKGSCLQYNRMGEKGRSFQVAGENSVVEIIPLKTRGRDAGCFHLKIDCY